MRFSAACVIGILGTAVGSPDASHIPDGTILDDDVCGEGEDSEACSLSFRQLRGQRLALQSRDGDDSGFCCYAWSDDADIGKSCYPTAKAKAGEYCASDKTCGGCGGTWVKMRCVFAGADDADVCGTAYDTAVAKDGDFCAQSGDVCEGEKCNGHWCVAPQAAAPHAAAKAAAGSQDENDGMPDDSESAASEAADAAPAAEQAPASFLAAPGDDGFCCYAWSDESDIGKSCYPTAKAKAGEYCASDKTCSGCGGTWVKMRCVFAGSDDADVCGTAYDTAVAKDGDFCAQSGDVCEGEKCNGHWCVAPQAAAPKILAKPDAADSKDAQGASDSEEPAAAVDAVPPKEDEPASLLKLTTAASNDTGYCCFSATKGTCGSCYPTARAKVGDYCATSKTCGGCGGTWCEMRCVYSGSDPSDVCGTAYDTAIAKADEFCGQSGTVCESEKCKGHWCSATNTVVPTKSHDDTKHADRRRRRRRHGKHGKGAKTTAAPAEAASPSSASEEPAAEAANTADEAPAEEPVAAAASTTAAATAADAASP